MTKELNAVCLSGGRLMAQYRMLEASHNLLTATPPLTVVRASTMVPQWVHEHLNETIEDWKVEEDARRNREWLKKKKG